MKMTDGISEDFPRGGDSAKEKVTKKRKRVDDDFQYKSQDELFKVGIAVILYLLHKR